jgi:hypothetical protein
MKIFRFWQVGKGDGVFLDVLNNDGTIKDWDFLINWLQNKLFYSDKKSFI